MKLRLISLIAALVIAPLSYTYALAVWSYFQSGRFFPNNELEAVVLGVQVAKLIAIMSVGRLRRTKFTVVVDIWAIDIILAPIAIVLTISENNPSYVSLAGQIFLSWASALLLLFPVYGIYEIASMVRRGKTGLTTVLPWATFLFALLTVFLSATKSVSFSGLAGLAQSIPFGLKGLSTNAPDVSLAAVPLYLGLMLYSLRPLKEAEAGAGLDLTLSFAFLGTGAALAWAALAASVNSVVLDFGIPSLVLTAIVWVVARGK